MVVVPMNHILFERPCFFISDLNVYKELQNIPKFMGLMPIFRALSMGNKDITDVIIRFLSFDIVLL